MTEVRFMLPLPPSVNALYATNWKTKRRFESERYERWKADALHCLLTNLPRPKHTRGKAFVTYLLGRPDRRRRDCENHLKACGDFLVAQHIIDDDSHIELILVGWTDNHPGHVEIIIRPYGDDILNRLLSA